MRIMSFDEANVFLGAYPEVRAALDRDGFEHVERLAGRITDVVRRERLMRGEIMPEEDVPPLGPTTLAEYETARDAGKCDNAKFVAAVYVYVHARAKTAA